MPPLRPLPEFLFVPALVIQGMNPAVIIHVSCVPFLIQSHKYNLPFSQTREW